MVKWMTTTKVIKMVTVDMKGKTVQKVFKLTDISLTQVGVVTILKLSLECRQPLEVELVVEQVTQNRGLFGLKNDF